MAGRIPQSFIDNLLDRTEIADVIGARVDLKKAGVNYKACCPFHNEKTPSFIVNPVKQFYHCFGGCGANGSAISFLMAYEHLSFPEAIEELASLAGLDVPRETYQDSGSGGSGQTQNQSPLYTALDACAHFFQQQLKGHPAAIDYLKQRGLSGETARHFGLGYAPNRWDALESSLPNCSQTDLLTAGMLIKNENGRVYDRFRDRIMFPIRDRRGRTIGFGGRVMGDGEPKYLNSPETPVFHKGEALYGLFEARQAHRMLDSLLVVEGYMDTIGLAQHGITYAVATLGTATTATHMEYLFRTVNDVVFCFDGDRAGRQAAWRALKTTLPTLQDGREARFLFLDEGEDPDSLIKSIGQPAFTALLKTALPVADFLFRELIDGDGAHSVGERARLAETARPLIDSIPGELYRTLLYQQLSAHVGTTFSSTSVATPPSSPPRPRRPAAYQVQLSPIRTAITLAIQHPGVVSDDDLEHYDFDENQRGGFTLQKLIGIILGNATISTAALLEHFRDASEWPYLCQLASSEIPGLEAADEERPRQLFLESIKQLTRANQRRAQAVLRERAASGVIDDELKAQLRATLPYTD